MGRFGVILFDTNSSAMQAEALLVRAKMEVKLIPTPRELSSDCGTSLRFDWILKNEVEVHLERAKVDFASIHPLFTVD
jgi:hypothetical protein